jgi:hypothetical protein
VLIWRVCRSLCSDFKYIQLTELGDVSLSAEDRPPPTKPPIRLNAHVLALPEPPLAERVDFSQPSLDVLGTVPVDGAVEGKMEEPRESWLGGEQAMKFLLAGGVAGAGESKKCTWLSIKLTLAQYQERLLLPLIVSKFSSSLGSQSWSIVLSIGQLLPVRVSQGLQDG